MLAPSILLPAILLYCYLATCTSAFEHCWHGSPINTSVADCKRAISIIPSGRIEFDGKAGLPLNFLLPDPARQPKIYFPAIFRAGTCSITASRPQKDTDERGNHFLNAPMPRKAATAMYFHVWPGIREAAEKIVERCLPAEQTGFNGGEAYVDIEVEGMTRKYNVLIQGKPPQPLGKPETRQRWRCNVYQLNDKGKVVRTCLDPSSPPRAAATLAPFKK